MSTAPRTNNQTQLKVTADATEFGLHMKQGGWRLGLLVARNVAPAPGRVAPETLLPKVNATEFARRAGTSNDRVLRHLAAWERAANAGLVPHTADLHPGSEVALDVESLPAWGPIYNAPATPRTRRAVPPPPSPVRTRTADPVIPATVAPTQDEIDALDAQVNRALEAANVRMQDALEQIRTEGRVVGDVATDRPTDAAAARNAEWHEDVRYAINAIAGHVRRLYDAARDEEWSDTGERTRAAADMQRLGGQLQMLAALTTSPDKGRATDEALASLMNN